MKLAEALAFRAHNAIHISDLQSRLGRSATVVEGEATMEEASDVFALLEDAIERQIRIVSAINHTNSITEFSPGISITHAIAQRDLWHTKVDILSTLIHTVSSNAYSTRGRTTETLRVVSKVSAADLRERIDRLSADLRELEVRLQQMNWTTDLLEVTIAK